MTNNNDSIEFEGEPESTEIDVGVLRELSRNTYTDPIACFRELIANGLDQYEKTDENGNALFTDDQKIINIDLDQIRHEVRCRDFATGIEEGKLREFKKVGTEDTKGISGKTVGFAQSSYKNIHETIQGQKRIGKLSFSEASETSDVWYYSNNGYSGQILRYLEFRWYGPTYRDTTKVLQSVGLEVRIKNAKPEVLNERVVRNAITKWFALRIAKKKARIYLNGIAITKGDLQTDDEETIDHLTNDTKIRARLASVDKPKYLNIDLYCKEIYVKPIHVDFLVEGYINCKDLEIGAGRDRFIESQDTHYPEFFALTMKHFADNFDRPGVSPERKMQNKKLKEDICVKGLEIFAELYPNYAQLVNGMAIAEGMKGIASKPSRTEEKEIEKETTETIENVKIVSGTTEGEIWIYGDKEREDTGGKTPIGENGIGEGQTIEPGGIYTAKRKISTKQNETTNVRPNVVVSELGRENARASLIETATGRIRVIFNTLHASTREAMENKKNKDPGNLRLILGTTVLFVRAMVDYVVTTTDTNMSTTDYSEMYEKLFDAMMDTPGKGELS